MYVRMLQELSLLKQQINYEIKWNTRYIMSHAILALYSERRMDDIFFFFFFSS